MNRQLRAFRHFKQLHSSVVSNHMSLHRWHLIVCVLSDLFEQFVLFTYLKTYQKVTEFTAKGLCFKWIAVSTMQNHYSAKTVIGIISQTVAQVSLLSFPLETLKSTTEYYTEINYRTLQSCSVNRLVCPIKLYFLHEAGTVWTVPSGPCTEEKLSR